ncbi:hypothetical protein K2634_002351 [Salmonella enterica subsp. enterica serovar Chester]|nr:hypothetical protein [Salmonella enterica subsp. enterica serovar Chester]
MWLSAIHRDLPKRDVMFTVEDAPIAVGVAKFERIEEGQFVVMDGNDNEFMLYHPEVDTSEICDGVLLLSWQNPETKEWMWCVAKPTNEAGTAYVFGEIYAEPEPH